MEEKISKINKEINSLENKTKFLLNNNIRLFLISKSSYIRISNKKIEQGYYETLDHFLIKSKRCDRGIILELFLKLEFIVNELIIFNIVGYDPKRAYLFDDILDKIDMHSKVTLLRDWKIIDNKLYNSIIVVKQVRNGLAHYWDKSEVLYKKKKLEQCLNNFFEDMKNIIMKLIDTYMVEQEKIDTDSIIAEIHKFKMVNAKQAN
jgi:hypothetical protein